VYLVSSNRNNETYWQSLMTHIWYNCNLQCGCKLRVRVCVCARACVRAWMGCVRACARVCVFVIPFCNWWYLKCWLQCKVTYCKPYCYGPSPRFCVPHWLKGVKCIHPNEEGNIDLNFCHVFIQLHFPVMLNVLPFLHESEVLYVLCSIYLIIYCTLCLHVVAGWLGTHQLLQYCVHTNSSVGKKLYLAIQKSR